MAPPPPSRGSPALLTALRSRMKTKGLDALVVPSEGEHTLYLDHMSCMTREADLQNGIILSFCLLPFFCTVVMMMLIMKW